jgi:hypothetical protein
MPVNREISIRNTHLPIEPKTLAEELNKYFIGEGGMPIQHPIRPGNIGGWGRLSFINFYWDPEYGSYVCEENGFTTIGIGGIEPVVERVLTEIENILKSDGIEHYFIKDVDNQQKIKDVTRTEEGKYIELQIDS